MAQNYNHGRLSVLYATSEPSSPLLPSRSNHESLCRHTLSPQTKSHLINENLFFYGRVTELEQLLQSEKEEKQKLCQQLEKKKATIKNLIEQTALTKDDEFQMASENLKLKTDLARERKLNERIIRSVDQHNAEKEFGLPLVAELREIELTERLKESIESARRSNEEAEMALIKLQTIEEEKDELLLRVTGLWKENRDLQMSVSELEVLKGSNEALEIQLQEARDTARDQLNMLEQLRKEHFALLKCPPPMFVEAESHNKENLEQMLQLKLRHRLERLEAENKELRDRNKSVTNLQAVELQNKLDEHIKKLKEASHHLVEKKSEIEKLTIDNQTLIRRLHDAETALVAETVNWAQRVETLEKRVETVEENRATAEESLRSKGSSLNEAVDKLYQLNTLIEELQTENSRLKMEIENAYAKVEAERQHGLRLNAELEDQLKPKIAELQQQLGTMESSNARLKGDLDIQKYLLKEEESVARQSKAQLDKAQQKLHERDIQLTQESRMRNDQAERLTQNEALLILKDSEIQHLNAKISSLQSVVDELKTDVHVAKEDKKRLSLKYEEVEGRCTMTVNEYRRALSDLGFCRQELERLTDFQKAQHPSEQARDERLRAIRDTLKRQIVLAQEELRTLEMDVEARVKNIPVHVSGASDEFEMVHVVEHFQKEKRKVVDELRGTTLRLSEVESLYHSLGEMHRTLQMSHARTLKELLELKEKASLLSSSSSPPPSSIPQSNTTSDPTSTTASDPITSSTTTMTTSTTSINIFHRVLDETSQSSPRCSQQYERSQRNAPLCNENLIPSAVRPSSERPQMQTASRSSSPSITPSGSVQQLIGAFNKSRVRFEEPSPLLKRECFSDHPERPEHPEHPLSIDGVLGDALDSTAKLTQTTPTGQRDESSCRLHSSPSRPAQLKGSSLKQGHQSREQDGGKQAAETALPICQGRQGSKRLLHGQRKIVPGHIVDG